MRDNKLRVVVRDLSLASAIATVGVEFADVPFFKALKEDGVEYSFFFKPHSDDGEYTTSDLIAWWYDNDFVKENPDHPFAYIKQAMDNRNHLLDLVKQSKGHFIIERKGKTAIIGEDLSEEDKNKILKRL